MECVNGFRVSQWELHDKSVFSTKGYLTVLDSRHISGAVAGCRRFAECEISSVAGTYAGPWKFCVCTKDRGTIFAVRFVIEIKLTSDVLIIIERMMQWRTNGTSSTSFDRKWSERVEFASVPLCSVRSYALAAKWKYSCRAFGNRNFRYGKLNYGWCSNQLIYSPLNSPTNLLIQSNFFTGN